MTGAGKTEMLFPGIAWALAHQWRVAIASPRVDVCLELAPRLQAAFADVQIAVLYGRNPAPYQYTQLSLGPTASPITQSAILLLSMFKFRSSEYTS
ncbi:hypothetical protein WP50_09385 [Lactiplantibacillus plantarum]|nr:hypothetical protein WP50_09385 [Lactiplantibacillus plantarum]